MLNIGKLYQVKKMYWLLYPSKAFAVASPDRPSRRHAECYSQAWSKQYNCKITFVSPNDIFCLLEQDGEYIKVLSTNGEIGWINHPTNEPWTKGCIEEVKQ